MLTLFQHLNKNLESMPSAFLTLALLLSAAVIGLVALLPNNVPLKAVILAYIIFP